MAGWKKLISIVDSPSNGITFDCGVTREMGEDPVEVCRYFASRDRINHVHFRNVLVIKPYERYREVWIDEGLNNMFAIMKELVKNKYSHEIYPEHPRRLDYDSERGPIGGISRRGRLHGLLRTTWVMRAPCCRRRCRRVLYCLHRARRLAINTVTPGGATVNRSTPYCSANGSFTFTSGNVGRT